MLILNSFSNSQKVIKRLQSHHPDINGLFSYRHNIVFYSFPFFKFLNLRSSRITTLYLAVLSFFLFLAQAGSHPFSPGHLRVTDRFPGGLDIDDVPTAASPSCLRPHLGNVMATCWLGEKAMGLWVGVQGLQGKERKLVSQKRGPRVSRVREKPSLPAASPGPDGRLLPWLHSSSHSPLQPLLLRVESPSNAAQIWRACRPIPQRCCPPGVGKAALSPMVPQKPHNVMEPDT